MLAFTNRNILLGVTGGVAAYKSVEIVRRLRDHGANVRVVMTAKAKEFITPLTLQAVSGQPVHVDWFAEEFSGGMGHIDLARWADLILIAPATADFMAQLAHGFAAELLATLCLASSAQVFIAPAMNQQMWQHLATQDNLQILQQRGVTFLGPDVGVQACGEFGPGRLLEPEHIIQQLQSMLLEPLLADCNVMITAGPTREAIDPVRYLSNHSSGKMGYALAKAAIDLGAKVTLVSGPVALAAPQAATLLSVETAEEMQQVVLDNIEQQDVFVGCAAVADYRPAEAQTKKIKKDNKELTLKLVRNPDIISDVAKHKSKPFVVGFAAQTHDVLECAQEKLTTKKLNMIVANQVAIADVGFDSDDNACTVISSKEQVALPKQNKIILAQQIMQLIAKQYEEETIHAKSSCKNS